MDVLILHTLSSRQKYNSLRHVVPESMLAPDTSAMLQWFGAYFAAFPGRDEVQVDELQSLIRLRSASAAPESVAIAVHLTEQLRQKPDEVALGGMLGQLQELDLSGRAASIISRYQAGEEVDLSYELHKLSSVAMRAKASATPTDYIRTSIDEILSEVADDKGLKFNFNQSLRTDRKSVV